MGTPGLPSVLKLPEALDILKMQGSLHRLESSVTVGRFLRSARLSVPQCHNEGPVIPPKKQQGFPKTAPEEPTGWKYARCSPLKSNRGALKQRPATGKQLAIPAADWKTSMRRRFEPKKPLVTSAAEAYPQKHNVELAAERCIVGTALGPASVCYAWREEADEQWVREACFAWFRPCCRRPPQSCRIAGGTDACNACMLSLALYGRSSAEPGGQGIPVVILPESRQWTERGCS